MIEKVHVMFFPMADEIIVQDTSPADPTFRKAKRSSGKRRVTPPKNNALHNASAEAAK
jgi:hypothetical protein